MTVELSELSLHLGDFIAKVKEGECLRIQQQGKDVAELRPPGQRTPRPFGLYKGEFKVTEAFFDPLPGDVLATIYDTGVEPPAQSAPTQ